jgi:nicotinamide-nucleotide adenylyltransferase
MEMNMNNKDANGDIISATPPRPWTIGDPPPYNHEKNNTIWTGPSTFPYLTPMPKKPFKFGFLLGRFQHIHIGHEQMIDRALDVCEKVLVIVGSAQDDARITNPIRNPFETHFRIRLINEIYKDKPNLFVTSMPDLTHENDHSWAWGNFVLQNVALRANQYDIKESPDIMVFGNDEERMSWFNPDDIKTVNQLIVARGNIDISATQMRNYLVENNFWKWRQYVNLKLSPLFPVIREELFKVEHYRKLAEENGTINAHK